MIGRSAVFAVLGVLVGCATPDADLSLEAETSERVEKKVGNFRVIACSSGVDYPDQGDEALDIAYEGKMYHARVLHPEVVPGPHFSAAMFWVSEIPSGRKSENEAFDFPSFLALRLVAAGLGWDSLYHVLFFAEEGREEGALRGFFCESGYDNADWGQSGLIFLHDGKRSSAYTWSYKRTPQQRRGTYELRERNDSNAPVSAALRKRLDPLLKHAEEAADGWPGP